MTNKIVFFFLQSQSSLCEILFLFTDELRISCLLLVVVVHHRLFLAVDQQQPWRPLNTATLGLDCAGDVRKALNQRGIPAEHFHDHRSQFHFTRLDERHTAFVLSRQLQESGPRVVIDAQFRVDRPVVAVGISVRRVDWRVLKLRRLQFDVAENSLTRIDNMGTVANSLDAEAKECVERVHLSELHI